MYLPDHSPESEWDDRIAFTRPLPYLQRVLRILPAPPLVKLPEINLAGALRSTSNMSAKYAPGKRVEMRLGE